MEELAIDGHPRQQGSTVRRGRKKLYGRRKHSIRKFKSNTTSANGRVRLRIHRQARIYRFLRFMSVPVLSLVPASVYFLEYPLNFVIAPALGVMGIVLIFGSK